jgi:hypothetical protein
MARYYSAGRRRAVSHIEAARRFSVTTGGADEDVKQWLFSLPPLALDPVLALYGRQYGAEARVYARSTIDKWRSGDVQMSGMVAERLFELLPIYMPIETKFKLVENLWKKLGPHSNATFVMRKTSDLERVIGEVEAHMDKVVIDFRIPEALERRFNWLARSDVDVKQRLLNHLQDLEKSVVAETLDRALAVLARNIDASGKLASATHTVSVNRHSFTVRVGDRPAAAPKLGGMPAKISGGLGFGLVPILLVLIAFLVWLGH